MIDGWSKNKSGYLFILSWLLINMLLLVELLLMV